jgi:aspartyl-tRNA(Asn)/glutamyl-tRNA(Gln) amidotransferase subunit B
MPGEVRERLQTQHGIKAYDAEVIVNQGKDFIELYETVVTICGDGKRASSWFQQDILRTINEQQIAVSEFPISGTDLGTLILKITTGELDNSRARDVFQHMLDHGDSAEASIKALGITSVDSSELEGLCRELLTENPHVVEDYRNGKQQAIGSLIGQAKKRNPNANPKTVRELLLQIVETL